MARIVDGDGALKGALVAAGFTSVPDVYDENVTSGLVFAELVAWAFLQPIPIAATLSPGRAINGVTFDGTADITVPAAAASLTGPTLAANVLNSSLTTFGIMAAPHMTSPVVDSGGLTVTAGTSSFGGTVNFSASARTLAIFATAGTGALLDGYTLGMNTAGKSLNLATTTTLGDKLILGYYDTGATAYRSALLVAATNGRATLELMTDGGTIKVGSTTATDLVVATAGAALATTATAGFLFASSCAGTPTGAPTGYTGTVPMVVDTTGSKIWFRIGGTWKGVVVA